MIEPLNLNHLTARLALTDAYAAGLRDTVAAARAEGAFTGEPPLGPHAWKVSCRIAAEDPPMAALLAAALRKADSGNAALIRACWPALAATCQARYDAPGGLLDHERQGHR